METKDNHLLTLKVMRLTKPNIGFLLPLTCEPSDLPGDSLKQAMIEDVRKAPGAELMGLGEMLTLPQSFGSIFLGETFSSYVSAHNDSGENATDVVVKTELQTGSQRVTLSKADAGAVPSLAPGNSVDDVVQHEVKELGIHILVCSVHYTNAASDRKFFRKFFKFQVFKPLDVKTKAYNLEDDIYLEAQVQNITSSPLNLESVNLQPPPDFTMEDLSVYQVLREGGVGDTETKSLCLSPQDTCQFLYRLRPDAVGGSASTRSATTIGKLDIAWRTSMGEIGRLQTSMLPRKPPPIDDIQVRMLDVPSHVECGKPFRVTAKLTNLSSKELYVGIQELKDQNRGIVMFGISSKKLGSLKANNSMEVNLQLVALTSGLKSVAGVALTIGQTKDDDPAIVEIKSFPDIFVHRGREDSQDPQDPQPLP